METETNKKRILYFIPEFPRLTETFIEREVSWLVKRGNLDLTVFSLQKASGKLSPQLEEKTIYRRLDFKYFVLGLSYFFTKPRKVFLLLQIVTSEPAKNSIRNLYLFLKSLGYTRMFSEENPDHIHAHFLSDPSTVAMIASEVLGIPFSVSGHAKDVLVDGTFLKEKITRSKFIAVCNTFAYKKCLSSVNENYRHKVHLIYHGIDAQDFNFLQNKSNDKPYILTVARLVEKKGLQYLIQASEVLKNEGLSHEIHIVGGPGDLYYQLEEMISQKNLQDCVFIEGAGKGVPHDQVVEMYKKADIFVLPSIETGAGDVDGVPNVIIEAALSKVPIVTTDAGGITDLIDNEETGLIVHQRDFQGIATQIYKLAHDSPLRSKLSENAYSKALKMFNMEVNVGKMENLFQI